MNTALFANKLIKLRIDCQLKNIRLCEINEQIQHPHQSGRICTPVKEQQVVEVLLAHLEKAIKFQWKDGKVGFLQLDANEAPWSVNFKKGIFSLFNINLRDLEALPTLPRPLAEAIETAVPSYTRTISSDYFRVMEKDLVGDCESIYAIDKEPVTPPVLTVTKVRNFDKCASKPRYLTGIFGALNCTSCSEDVRSKFFPLNQYFLITIINSLSTYYIRETNSGHNVTIYFAAAIYIDCKRELHPGRKPVRIFNQICSTEWNLHFEAFQL